MCKYFSDENNKELLIKIFNKDIYDNFIKENKIKIKKEDIKEEQKEDITKIGGAEHLRAVKPRVEEKIVQNRKKKENIC